jgi:C4-dicarboxylate-specific signal transduction histidine kinase
MVKVNPFWNFLIKLIAWKFHHRTVVKLGFDDLKNVVVNPLELKRLKGLAMLGELSGSLIHELNTPLGVISLSASDLSDVCANGTLDRNYFIKSLTDIENSSYKVRDIAKTIKRHSEMESEKEFLFISIKDILSDMNLLLESKIKKHNVSLEILNSCPNQIIQVMPISVVQVLINLILNSIAEIESSNDPWIKLEISTVESNVLFKIIDSGKVNQMKSKKNIFTKGLTTKQNQGGTGFGLYFSKKIAQEHGGDLILYGHDGHPCFELKLPIIQLLEDM